MGAESKVLGTVPALFFLAHLFGTRVEARLVFRDTILGFGRHRGFLAGMANLGREVSFYCAASLEWQPSSKGGLYVGALGPW